MKLSPSLIHLRPATETDIGFILRTWIDSFRDSPFGKQLTLDTYETIQKETVMNFIATNQVLIACVPDEPDSLIGFICHGKVKFTTVVHYLYVKFAYRNAGVAQMLLNSIKPSTPIVCTQVNKRFYELRSINFLPMMTIREYDDLLTRSSEDSIQNQCNQWFINHLQEFRDHRSEIMKERNQRAYRKRHSDRVSDSMPATRGLSEPLQACQETTNETDRSTTQRTPGIESQRRGRTK